MSLEIVVRGPNWLGDLVMCTPAFRVLRQTFASDRIVVQAPRALLPLLDGSPWFDARVPVDDRVRGPLSLFAEARKLRAAAVRGFDLGLCIPDSWSSALVLRAAGVRRLVGHPRAGRGLLLHRAVPLPPGIGRRRLIARERHALGLAAAVGAVSDDVSLALFTTDAEDTRARALLSQHGLAEGAFLALAPGASYGTAKRWPAESFARVADDALGRGVGVCLLGAPGEEQSAAAVRAAMRGRAVDLTGQLDVGVLKAVLRRARALVCNDAGARHVAVAFGVPCVVMFGPTSLQKTDCNLEQVRVVETEVDCRPCYERVCPIDHRCMTRLAPERVRDSVFAALDEGPLGELRDQGRRRAENAGT